VGDLNTDLHVRHPVLTLDADDRVLFPVRQSSISSGF